MKKFLRNALVGVMLAATVTTLFVGCGKGNDAIPADSSAIVSQEESPGYADYGDTNAETSLYKVYWNDNAAVKEDQEQKLIKAREGATVVEGSTMFNGLFKVYQDEDGEQFIISNATRVYLTEDGKVPAKDMTDLRLEGTGDRVYLRDTDIEVEAAKNAVNDFMRFVDGGQAGYDDRTPISAQSDEVKLLISQATAARVNNMPAAQTISVYNGYIELYSLLDTMSEMGYVSDFSAGYTTDDAGKEFMEFLATVNAVGNHFATKVLVDMETGIITEAIADGKEFSLSQSGVDENGLESEVPAPGVQISLQDLEDFYGWDVEVYADESVGEPFINIVTDNRDIAKSENFIAYQVYKEETATGTGAGDIEQTAPTEDLSPLTDEEKIQRLMDRTGASREEVIALLEQVRKENEEAMKQEAEEKAADEARHDEWIAWRDQECLEQTGMTYEEFSKMTPTEYFEWMNNHPDIDRSFLQGYPG